MLLVMASNKATFMTGSDVICDGGCASCFTNCSSTDEVTDLIF